MAVVAPIPSPSVTIATAAKPGFSRSIRLAKRSSRVNCIRISDKEIDEEQNHSSTSSAENHTTGTRSRFISFAGENWDKLQGVVVTDGKNYESCPKSANLVL